MSAWLEAWLKNKRVLEDRYGIQISRQSPVDPQAVKSTDPNGQSEA